jgi:hypothetical protein
MMKKKDSTMPGKYLLIVLIVMNLALGACTHSSPSAASPATVPVAVIAGGPLAAGDAKTAGGIWITDPKQLETQAGRMLKGSRIPNHTGSLSEIDFSADGVLLIWMGKKQSGGYALNLLSDRADIENRTVRVSVGWIKPHKGAIVTQMITNPYLIIRLARGAYDTITVVDADGRDKVVVDAISGSK